MSENASDLLEEEEIRNFLEHNQGTVRQMQRAAELLKDKADAKTALLKAAKAFKANRVSVFFSYKQKDENTAVRIVSALRSWGGNSLKISFQKDFGQKIVGQDWRANIRREVSCANIFILLLPDPNDDWDWCLFETGLFEGQMTSADRLICLHHPDTVIPNQIEDLHAVKAVEDRVKNEFLTLLLTSENAVPGFGPVHPYMREEDLQALAVEIVDAIQKPVKWERKIYEPWISVKIEEPGELQTKEQLDDVPVIDCNKEALDVFEMDDKEPSLGCFRKKLPENKLGGEQWYEELFRVIQKIGRNTKHYAIQSVFTTYDGSVYRPVVSAVDREEESKRIRVFHIIFVEDVAVIDRAVMPTKLSLMANALRSAFRFRWEVLERFATQPLAKEDVIRLENAMMRIRLDWESRNIGGEEELLAVFTNKGDKDRIRQMFSTWYEARNPNGTGTLDRSIKNGDLEEISKLLKVFLPINQKFLEMIAERFSLLIEHPA